MAANDRKFLEAGRLSARLQEMGTPDALMRRDSLGAAVEGLKLAQADWAKASAKVMQSRAGLRRAPRELKLAGQGLMLVAVQFVDGFGGLDVTGFELADPRVFCSELAGALEGRGRDAETLARALRETLEANYRLEGALRDALSAFQATDRRYKASQKELVAAMAQVEAFIHKATPQERYGRKHKRARRSATTSAEPQVA